MNNRSSKQKIINNYELVVLMPKILGDAMMSVQALHCYSELIASNLLIVTDSIYQNIFSLIFKNHTVREPLINSASQISVVIKSVACASVFLEKTALIRGSLDRIPKLLKQYQPRLL